MPAPTAARAWDLPIAVKLAELHGGSLTIASQLGAGTTVTVTLPANG